MDLGGGGNGGGVSGLMPDERKGGGGRLDFASNGQTPGYHNNSQAYGVGQTFRMPDGKVVEIRNVWSDNLEREMRVIRDLIKRYPFVAMDTEFPGVVARPVGDFNQPDYQYQTLRCNVDLLKIIQLGLSFANERGELPDIGCCTWQFNFVFNLSEDMYAHDSIQLLKNSGIDFEAHERRGIDLQHFGELLMTSGLVLMPNVTWLSFHSGYDFGYLLKLLTCNNLPQQESEFFDLLQLYFPKIYDIKFLVSSQNGFHGGLNKLAEELKIERIGPIHQAGSDSLLTEQVFLKVSDVFFNGVENLDKGKFKGKFVGQLYGYGGNQTGIFRPGNKTGHHNNGSGGGGSGAASGVGSGNGTNSAAALVTAAVGNNNNNGSSNNSSASNGNNNINNGTAAGQQGAPAGRVSPSGNDANSSATVATDAATGASGVAATSASGSAAVNPPTAGETAGNAGVSHDAGGVTSGPAIGDPLNASPGSSNSVTTGTGVAAASGDANSAQDESTAGGGTEGPPGVPGNGAGAPVS